MAKLKIYKFPDTVLSNKSDPIVRVETDHHKLADDMLETMYDAPGIGLAANQVGILKRLLVLDIDYEVEEEPGKTSLIKNKKPLIVINPRIIHHEGSVVFKEGCLSVPDFSAEVKRYEKIKVEYQDVDGALRNISVDGLLAIAFQHEMDHLDGKLFIDRLNPLKKEMIHKKLRQARETGNQDLMPGEAALAGEKKKRGL
ncbi:MAG: peptide deformylase [Bdellovibrionota bacterium]